MRVEATGTADAERWQTVLDATEQARAARFVFNRHRMIYIAAHALLRSVLCQVVAGTKPADWRLVAGQNGEPEAWLADRPGPLSFNLSHTGGMVGLATVASRDEALGFDLEALDRRINLDIASHYFCAEEVMWLHRLPPADRPEGFLRLWTLKEAFIKATGEGLARDLASFWFEPELPRIHFEPHDEDAAGDWQFEQRVTDGGFIASAGIRRRDRLPVTFEWKEIAASGFQPAPP
nr:4'-phosphopantetheinyl transferase superfamily protein [uncultured Rhodopila sp.]